MIPEKLVDFMNSPVIIILGTRNNELQPAFNRSVGVNVSEDRETMTVYVYEPFAEVILKNLNENGRIAVIAVTLPSHETYQFKGAFVSSRKTIIKDIEIQENYRKKVLDHFTPLGLPENFLRNMPYKPGIAVTFRVEDIFVQTPGPGAGKKIDFS